MKNNWMSNGLKKTCVTRRTFFPARLALVLLLIGVSTNAMAQYACTINGDNTITITGDTGSGGAVTIPSSISGRTVTGIYEWTFSSCCGLTEITIPESVTFIGCLERLHSLEGYRAIESNNGRRICLILKGLCPGVRR